MTLIRNDAKEKIKDFEVSASYLLPYDSISKRKMAAKKDRFDFSISAADILLVEASTSGMSKPSKEKLVLSLCFANLRNITSL